MNQPSDAERERERDLVLNKKYVSHRDFRSELIRAEKHVCDLISSMLLDNELTDVVDQLTSVRRSIHYSLAHNEFPIPTLQELTVPMPVRVPSGPMESLVIAREIAIQLRLKTRSLDSAIETLEHAIRRSRYAIHGEPSVLTHGVRRVFVATDCLSPRFPMNLRSVAMIDDEGNELFLYNKLFGETAPDGFPQECVQRTDVIRHMVRKYLEDRRLTRGRKVELWGYGRSCHYDYVLISGMLDDEGDEGRLPSMIYNVQQLHESLQHVVAIPNLDAPFNVLEEAKWVKSCFDAIQSAITSAAALAEAVSKK